MPHYPIDFKDLKRQASVRKLLETTGWRAVWSRGEQARGPCPIHGSASPDSRVFACKGSGYYCHKCKAKGDIIRLWMTLQNMEFVEAATDIVERLGIHVDPLLF